MSAIECDESTESREIVEFFPCPHCDGHGSRVVRKDGAKHAELCQRCDGEGTLGATEDDLERASEIGSDNPFCPHDWSSGYDDTDHEVAIYCGMCGACGDA